MTDNQLFREIIGETPPHVARFVGRHFGDGAWDNGYLLRMMQELFRFRDAFRAMRNGSGWE